MVAVNQNECKELAEYICQRIVEDDTWNGYEEEGDVVELFQPETPSDDFSLPIGNRDYVSRSHGIRIVNSDTFDGNEVEYQVIVKRVR